MEKKDHWKSLNSTPYMGAHSLDNGNYGFNSVVVKIIKACSESISLGGPKETHLILYVESFKPIVLNSTNSKRISKIYGSNYVQDWSGKLITLYVEKVKFKGEFVDCLRVGIHKPKSELPELNEKHDRWSAALKSVSSGDTKIDQLLEYYTISEENRVKLCGI